MPGKKFGKARSVSLSSLSDDFCDSAAAEWRDTHAPMVNITKSKAKKSKKKSGRKSKNKHSQRGPTSDLDSPKLEPTVAKPTLSNNSTPPASNTKTTHTPSTTSTGMSTARPKQLTGSSQPLDHSNILSANTVTTSFDERFSAGDSPRGLQLNAKATATPDKGPTVTYTAVPLSKEVCLKMTNIVQACDELNIPITIPSNNSYYAAPPMDPPGTNSNANTNPIHKAPAQPVSNPSKLLPKHAVNFLHHHDKMPNYSYLTTETTPSDTNGPCIRCGRPYESVELQKLFAPAASTLLRLPIFNSASEISFSPIEEQTFAVCKLLPLKTKTITTVAFMLSSASGVTVWKGSSLSNHSLNSRALPPDTGVIIAAPYRALRFTGQLGVLMAIAPDHLFRVIGTFEPSSKFKFSHDVEYFSQLFENGVLDERDVTDNWKTRLVTAGL